MVLMSSSPPLIFKNLYAYILNMTTATIKPKIVLKNGKPEAVVLDIGVYKKLLEIAEEKEDLVELKKIKSQKTSFRNLNDVLKERV